MSEPWIIPDHLRGMCANCGLEFCGPFNLGMSDIGILYCDRCGRSLVFKVYGSSYESVIRRQVMPWVLDEPERRWLESNLIACPCGGRFCFDSAPKCPKCQHVIPIQPMWPVETRNGLSEERGDAVWDLKSTPSSRPPSLIMRVVRFLEGHSWSPRSRGESPKRS